MVKLDALEGIVEFVATANAGSFSAAADATSTSVANISRKVAALEKRLSQQLLLRTARGCTLTEAGQNFYQTCRGLLDGLEESFDALQPGVTELQGSIKISLAGHFSEQYILPLLAAFSEQHPGVSVNVNVTARNVDLVAENVDMCVRVGPLLDSALIARKLIDIPLRTLISPVLSEKLGKITSPDDLPESKCLPLLGRRWYYQKDGVSKTIEPRGRFASDNGMALVAAAARGLGAIQVPSYYGQQALDSGELITILEDWHPRESFEFYLVFPSAKYLPQRVRALADFLKAQLSSNPKLQQAADRTFQ